MQNNAYFVACLVIPGKDPHVCEWDREKNVTDRVCAQSYSDPTFWCRHTSSDETVFSFSSETEQGWDMKQWKYRKDNGDAGQKVLF